MDIISGSWGGGESKDRYLLSMEWEPRRRSTI